MYTAANNGNLLINVGSKADGIIPDIQKHSLLEMGKWLEGNGEAIYDTTVSRREILRGDGCNVAFTAKWSTIYAIADSDKPGEILIEGLTGQPLFLSDHSGITWRQEEEGLRIVFESACEMPVTMKFANGEP
jgi:alpha-L-fucosidase